MMGLGPKDENVQKRSPASFDFRHKTQYLKITKKSHFAFTNAILYIIIQIIIFEMKGMRHF